MRPRGNVSLIAGALEEPRVSLVADRRQRLAWAKRSATAGFLEATTARVADCVAACGRSVGYRLYLLKPCLMLEGLESCMIKLSWLWLWRFLHATSR
jgi:hypothetical protein